MLLLGVAAHGILARLDTRQGIAKMGLDFTSLAGFVGIATGGVALETEELRAARRAGATRTMPRTFCNMTCSL